MAVTWGGWNAEGFDPGADPVDSSDDVMKEGVCSVDESGVVSAGESAAADDICKIHAVASHPDYEDSEPVYLGELVVANKGTLGTLTAPVYGGILAARGYPVAIATAPAITPAMEDAEVVWTYQAEGYRDGNGESGICSVDDEGTVTPGAATRWGDTCDVVARAEVPGYDPKEITATLNIHDTFDSVVWDSFPATGAVGVPVDLSGGSDGPGTVPQTAGVDYTVRKLSGECAYSNAKVLSFTGTAPCVLEVTASHPSGHRLDTLGSFSVTPEPGTIGVAGDNWGSYAAGEHRGGDGERPRHRDDDAVFGGQGL